MAYATVTDLETRWRTLSAPEKAQASALLNDAEAQILTEVPDVAERITEQAAATPPSTLLKQLVVRVECAMVKRAMAGGDAFGVTATQETTGPFSRSVTVANPLGDLYLTRAERRLLGGGGQRAFTIDTGPSTRTDWDGPVNWAPDPTWGILPEVP